MTADAPPPTSPAPSHPFVARLLNLLPASSLLRDPRLAGLLASILLVYLGLGVIIPVRALFARDAGLSLLGIGLSAVQHARPGAVRLADRPHRTQAADRQRYRG
jgi:hypothetical protein